MDILKLASEFDKLANIDSILLKKIERAKKLAEFLRKFSEVFEKSPEEAQTKFGTEMPKIVAGSLLNELELIESDIHITMKSSDSNS